MALCFVFVSVSIVKEERANDPPGKGTTKYLMTKYRISKNAEIIKIVMLKNEEVEKL